MASTRRSDGYTQWLGARPTPGATALMITMATAYIVLLFVNDQAAAWIKTHFGLIPTKAIGPWPWQLLTSWLIADGFRGALVDVLGAWWVGTSVEQQSSRRFLLTVFAGAQFAGILVLAAWGRIMGWDALLMLGASPGIIGLVAAFGLIYGDMPVLLFGLAQIRARILAYLILGVSLFISLLNQSWASLLADLASIAAAAFIARGGVRRVERAWGRWRMRRLRRRYQVLQGGRSGGTGSGSKYVN